MNGGYNMAAYIVRFIRVDGRPNEEYYYMRKEDAIYHYRLFLDDDSGLYSKIVLLHPNGEVIEELICS